jgi:hypothetical protein
MCDVGDTVREGHLLSMPCCIFACVTVDHAKIVIDVVDDDRGAYLSMVRLLPVRVPVVAFMPNFQVARFSN